MRELMSLEALLAPRGRHELASKVEDAFHASGKLRDAQLDARAMQRLSSRVPAAAALARHEQQRLPRLQRRLQRKLECLHARRMELVVAPWLARPATTREAVSSPALRRLQSAHRRYTRAGAWPSAPHALHRRRQQLKQLRYMAALARDAGCALPRDLSLARLASLQRRLGAVTDLDMELKAIRRFGKHHGHWSMPARELRDAVERSRASAFRALQRTGP
jgi:CHAD domain-containing protein